MRIHSYHYQLIRCHARQKIKGDFRLPLTCADRKALLESMKTGISENYIVKVLAEGGEERLNLSEYVLNELAYSIEYEDWNAFLRTHPLPTELHGKMSPAKRIKRTGELVEQRMAELNDP